MVRQRTAACGISLILAAALSTASGAQNVDGSKGTDVTLHESRSSNELGQVLKLNAAVGYNWNKCLDFDAALPVYFINTSPASTITGGSPHPGNVYADAPLKVNERLLNYQSKFTGTAPADSESAGFSACRASYAFNNIDVTVLRRNPFVAPGHTNTLSDTHLLQRHSPRWARWSILKGISRIEFFPRSRSPVPSVARCPAGAGKCPAEW
ncbi:MAG: hypothetical protein ABSF45_18110 [Terriglobia bacterium]